MKKRGFTLIELLVVIAIIGILASIVLVSMGGARASARDATRKADMRQIITAQEMYYGDHDDYYTCNGSGADCGTLAWPTGIGSYMLKTPSDPGSGAYVWVNNAADSTSFCVYTILESPSTPTTYYTASNAGNFGCSDAAPTLADCCF